MTLTWDQCVRISKALATRITLALGDDARQMNVYAIPRGGLCVSALLSYWLGLSKDRMLTTNVIACRGKILVVDAIADTGKTMLETVRHIDVNAYGDRAEGKVIYTAVLVTRHSCSPKPLFTGITYPGDDWVTFPWEVSDDQPAERGVVEAIQRQSVTEVTQGSDRIQGGIPPRDGGDEGD